MAYMSEEDAQSRVSFYHDNNISWVARPQNNQDGYIRKGRFKKASNMNFALNIANKVEDEVLRLLSGQLEKNAFVDMSEEEAVYQQALRNVLEGDPRARAGGDIRIGEIILLVDCDTRVVRIKAPIFGEACFRLNIIYSPSIALFMVPEKCTSVLKWQLSNNQQVSCKFPETTLKMV